MLQDPSSKMHRKNSFANSIGMRLSTKIFIGLFIVTLIPTFFLGQYVFAGIQPLPDGFAFNFEVWGIVGICLMVINAVFGNILFFRFLKTQSLSKVLFFSTVPLTISYGIALFLLADISKYNTGTAQAVRAVLNISTTNTYNTILWAVLISVVYVVALFVIYLFLCRPVTRVEKIVSRLSDGMVKEDKFTIGSSKQFRSMEHALNKINYQYREKENQLKKTNLEAQKFIPKQFFKFLGKNNISELELGNQVKKTATTLFCDLKSSTEVSRTLSLEENFNFINSYLNVASPIIRRYDGFVDKYLGDGILAVFPRPESALECAHAIVRAIEVKNRAQRDLPEVNAMIGIHTGEVIFGIVGEEERKSPTIISDVVNLASKIEDINKFLHTKLIFSKTVLNELPTKYKLRYRYLGSLNMDEGSDLPLFESLEIYARDKREKLSHLKTRFENAVRAYNEGSYENAAKDFEVILQAVPEDNPSYIYYNKAMEKIKRIE